MEISMKEISTLRTIMKMLELMLCDEQNSPFYAHHSFECYLSIIVVLEIFKLIQF